LLCKSFAIRFSKVYGGRRVRDRMVVGFTTSCAISVYQHKRCEV